MSIDKRNRVEVCFTPEEYSNFKNEFEIVVVIDVLRATSAICSALKHGVKAIIPVRTLEEALDYKSRGFIVAAERKGKIVDGFDIGNSPYSYMNNPKLFDKEVVLTTTNGTKALDIAKDADFVVVGSLLNLDFLNKWLSSQKKNV
ncbi:MAG: 2-phosphosulfolactate phosphatase, partial [Crocinitomicaceae bacterium]|nr:2-phosphosulfolactate phosphatase [Crocinitomicaceae bacterium]